jgi:ADP-ribose pyrophosphatase YjhB (NUDIX family)
MQSVKLQDYKSVFTKAGVGVIIRDELGRILLERRSDCGLWGLIGGKIDPGESILSAAVREAKEESGLDVEVEYLQGVYSDPSSRTVRYSNGDTAHLIDTVVVAKVNGGVLTCSHESLAVDFFHRDSLPSPMIEAALAPLEDYCNGLRGVIR